MALSALRLFTVPVQVDVCDHQLPTVRSLGDRIANNILNVRTGFGRSTMFGEADRPTGRRARGAGDRESEPQAGRVSARVLGMDTLLHVVSVLSESLDILDLIIGGLVGYVLATKRDRSATVRTQRVAVIADLHASVVKIARKQLSDGLTIMLAASIEGGTAHVGSLSDEEVEYQAALCRWSESLKEAEDKARLWLDGQTVDMVSVYGLLIGHCAHWGRFGNGLLTDDGHFCRYMRCMFGYGADSMVRRVLMGDTPHHVDLIALSRECLGAIQRRIRCEMNSPFRFSLLQLRESLSGEARRRSEWRR